ncbi:autotransporter domain-containing protein, partial [Klebsiella oxytoca]
CHSHADYNNSGYGGSLKAGWKWQHNAMFVEPYAEMSAYSLQRGGLQPG